jgi:hypothetical protein
MSSWLRKKCQAYEDFGKKLVTFGKYHTLTVATLSLIVIMFLIWLVPKLQMLGYTQDTGDPSPLEMETKLRAMVAQMVAGIFVLFGLYLGWRRVSVAHEGQITERFTRAVDQLGSDKLEIRLGGIYALERIAKDSADKDHWTIMEILTAFVRERSPVIHQLPMTKRMKLLWLLSTLLRREWTHQNKKFAPTSKPS